MVGQAFRSAGIGLCFGRHSRSWTRATLQFGAVLRAGEPAQVRAPGRVVDHPLTVFPATNGQVHPVAFAELGEADPGGRDDQDDAVVSDPAGRLRVRQLTMGHGYRPTTSAGVPAYYPIETTNPDRKETGGHRRLPVGNPLRHP